MMQYGNFPGFEKPVSRMIQGTVMLSEEHQDWSHKLLDEIFEAGGRAFDTAHGYGRGDSERTLGSWMKKRGVRDQLVIVDKGAHPYEGRKRVTPEDITSDVTESLERLQVDFIDLYLLHRDDTDVPVGPIVEVLNKHLKAGHFRAFGGSNWTYQRLQEANDYAKAHGLTPFTFSSPNFSLARQAKEPWPGCVSISYDSAAQAFYKQNQMPIIAWSSLSGGFFSGRFKRDNLNSFTDYMDTICVEAYCIEENFKRLERAQQLASETGLSLPQVAMAYVMSQPLNIFAVVGCQNGAEFKMNMDALTLKLPQDKLDWLAGKTA